MDSPTVPEPPDASSDECRADYELVQRAIAGDRTALEDLGARLETVQKMVTAANRRLPFPLPSDELADLAQDTVLIIWEKLETFEGRSTLEGWAWRFGVLELRNRVRGVARRRVRTGTSLAALETEPSMPVQSAMEFSTHELDSAIQNLPEVMSEVVRLKHDDGLLFREIAARLQIPENTAKTRYYRGIARMRAFLDEISPEPASPPTSP